MALQLTRRLITVDEYDRMAEAGILTEHDRVELIHGEIIEMSPIGSKHASTVNRISNLLKDYLGKRAIISVQNPIRIGDLSEPEPDVAVLKPAKDFYAEQHPGPQDIVLIVEVAGTSLEYDREVKMPLYASAGIHECWLINLEQKEIEAYRFPTENAFKLRELCRPGDQVTLHSLQASFSVNELLS